MRGVCENEQSGAAQKRFMRNCRTEHLCAELRGDDGLGRNELKADQ